MFRAVGGLVCFQSFFIPLTCKGAQGGVDDTLLESILQNRYPLVANQTPL